MKNSKWPKGRSAVGRRDFIKVGAGAGAMTSMMSVLKADEMFAAQQLPPWEARPKTGGSRPVSVDVHTHWFPEPYTKVLAELGRPIANPDPLNFDLDVRRKWMDEHGVQMHVLTLSGAMPWQWASPEVLRTAVDRRRLTDRRSAASGA